MNRKELQTKLQSEQNIAPWKDLRPHAARGAIILVNNRLSLVDVGIEFALDNKEQVAQWIAEELISKPDQDFLNQLEKEFEKKFSFLIIQPFVLIQQLLN